MLTKFLILSSDHMDNLIHCTCLNPDECQVPINRVTGQEVQAMNLSSVFTKIYLANNVFKVKRKHKELHLHKYKR